MMFSRKKRRGALFTLHVLIYEEEDVWYAHCLELDIVASGDTPAEAGKDIKGLIIAQFEFAEKNNNLDNVFFPAPAKYWAMLGNAKSCESRRIKDHPPIGRLEHCFA